MIYSLLGYNLPFKNYRWGSALSHLRLLFCKIVYNIRRFVILKKKKNWICPYTLGGDDPKERSNFGLKIEFFIYGLCNGYRMDKNPNKAKAHCV